MNAPTTLAHLLPAEADAGRVLRSEGTRVACPHCDAPSELRDMKRKDVLVWRAVYRCDNDECGHTFLAEVTLVRRLKQSAQPNPAIDLPMSVHARTYAAAEARAKAINADLFADPFNLLQGDVAVMHFPRRLAKATAPKQYAARASDDGKRVVCPDCGADAVIRTSGGLGMLLRETTYHCTNHACGGVLVAHKEIVCTLSPSATPNPAVQLPMSSHVQRDLLRVVIDNAEAYDYQAHNTAPVSGCLFAEAAPP